MLPRKLGAVTAAQLPQITHVTDDDGDVLQVALMRRIEYDVAGRYVLFLVQWPDGFKGFRRISLDSQVYLVGRKATP